MSESNNTTSGGIGFWSLLTVLFIGLKLTGHIEWSWWWVLSPIWIICVPVVLIIAISVVVAIFCGKDN